MASTSKNYVEEWVEYDKSDAKFRIEYDIEGEVIGRNYQYNSATLPKIDGKWKILESDIDTTSDVDWQDDESDDYYGINKIIDVCLEVKDWKLLQLFRAKTVVKLSSPNEYESHETEYEKISNEKNVFNITHFLDKMDNLFDREYSYGEDERKFFKAEAVMTIYMKRLIKKKIPLIDILNDHFKAQKMPGDFIEDFTFIVKGREFKANKARMSKVSSYMNAMVQHVLLERAQAIEIVDIEPDIFQILLHFINGERTNFKKLLQIGHICSMFKAAYKFQVEDLMDFCIAVMFQNFTEKDHVVETYEFACYYGIEDLKMYCWDIIQFDILEIFQPMEPLPAKKVVHHLNTVKRYFKIREEMDKELQNHHELFSSTIKLDDDSLQSFAKIYTAKVVSGTSHLN